MDRIIKEQYIVSLIVKEMAGTISEPENFELQCWLSESQEHQKSYEQLKQTKIDEELQRYRRLDSREGWKKYKALRGGERRHRIMRWNSVAAAVIILLMGMWVLMRPGQLAEESIGGAPGSSKAVLILADGTQKELATPGKEEILHLGTMMVKNNGTSICYETMQKSAAESSIVYNELKIPTGGEYQLVLADGTHVWLNSQTKLRYPVRFTGNKREVYLEGEAYFEVTKDKEHPFCVMTRKAVSVEVLGTSFNVRAYQDENQIETVLEEGCVKMSAAGQVLVLQPGNRSSYDIHTRNMNLETVNTRLYTEWRTGQFTFVKKRVEDILRDVARWYNIDIFYQSEAAKDILFSGSFKKYESITPLLEAIEVAGGVVFDFKGRTLTVSIAQDY